jgi:hypothetical protein
VLAAHNDNDRCLEGAFVRHASSRQREDNRCSARLQAVGDPLKQYESLLKFALTCGTTGRWGLVGGSAALIVGIVLHAAVLSPFALVGLMAGMRIYSTRIFRKVPETDSMAELHAYLRDLKLYWVQGFITEEQYVRAKEKALKNKKIL